MKKLTLALILIGITSMAAQIVIVRELLIIFYGNELSIGIILANWLFWTSLGSWLGGRVSKRITQPVITLALTEIITSFLLITTILLTRGLNLIIPASAGEMLGIIPVWLYSFILLTGICAANGFLFVIGCSSVKSAGKAYLLESIGAGAGGLFCSIVLLRFCNTIQIIWLLVLANLLTAGLLWKRSRWFIITGAVLVLFLGMSGVINILHTESRRWQWKNYTVAKSQDSIYGNITVTRRGSVYDFYESGLLAFSVPDKLTSEETAHLALLQHPEPKDLLLIGGGAGGVLEECLKYADIRSIHYIELDPLIINLAGKFLPMTNDPKVKIFNIDARRFLNTTKNIYDVIIVNLPDPKTAQINRYYTLEFFRSAKDHLSNNGILSLGAVSSENYISPELGEYLRCIYYTLKEVFPVVKALPGDYARFLAGKSDAHLTDDYRLLQERLKADTQYVRDYYLKYKFSPERLNYFYNQLTLERPMFLNRDFHPICYYYNITFWSTYFNITFKRIFRFMAKIRLWHFSFLLLIAALWPRRKSRDYVLLPLMTSGFSEISFQIVTILAFQVIYGYVYYKLGIILTSFMIGLALGSWSINKTMPRIKNHYRLFLFTQISIVIYPLLLPLIFRNGPAMGWLGENIIFPYLPVLAGFIGGYQFPLGNKIYLGGKKELGYSAGITYGIDLFGSCIGLLLISAFILPVLGITQTCFLTSIVNTSALIFLIRSAPLPSPHRGG